MSLTDNLHTLYMYIFGRQSRQRLSHIKHRLSLIWQRLSHE